MEFKSPINGFLAVYCYNCEDESVLCALPYETQTEGFYPVVANHKYRLFSEQEAVATPDHGKVYEIKMTTTQEKELNVLYVLFSPNKFIKAADNDGDIKNLRSLSLDSFEKWLSKQRTKDPDLVVTSIPLTISK